MASKSPVPPPTKSARRPSKLRSRCSSWPIKKHRSKKPSWNSLRAAKNTKPEACYDAGAQGGVPQALYDTLDVCDFGTCPGAGAVFCALGARLQANGSAAAQSIIAGTTKHRCNQCCGGDS